MKRISLNRTSYFHAPVLWMATSNRYGVSAYGPTVAEARRRLFHARHSEQLNRCAAEFTRIRALPNVFLNSPGPGPLGPVTCGHWRTCKVCYPGV